MKSIIFVLLSFIHIMMPISSISDFESTIQTGYIEYEVLVDDDNLYYNLQIIWGKIDQGETKIGYGVFLESKTNDSYQVVISDRFFSREIRSDARGDTVAHYFDVKNLTNPKLYIYNRSGKIMFEMKLPTVESTSQYDNKVSINNIGLNNSSAIEKTELELGVRSYYTILIASTLVIFVSLIILAIILLKKLSTTKMDTNNTGIKPLHFFGATEESKRKNYVLDDAYKIMQNDYDFDQDYDLLTVQEKQKKMAELMRLYNKGDITIDQLNHELRRLW
jgi:hypothetical protein